MISEFSTKFSNKFIVNMVKQVLKNVTNDTRQILGRWCHVSLPNCSIDVVKRKIDFANRDNSLCILHPAKNQKNKL